MQMILIAVITFILRRPGVRKDARQSKEDEQQTDTFPSNHL